jgi:hypothetical protein
MGASDAFRIAVRGRRRQSRPMGFWLLRHRHQAEDQPHDHRKLEDCAWIVLPEILLCFVPLSIAWLDSIFGGSGVIRLNVDVIHRYFVGVPGGELVLIWMISTAILGALGLVGLIAGFRVAVLGRSLRTNWLRIALVIGPLLYGVLILNFPVCCRRSRGELH